jgi:hypothetical protein
MLRLGVTLLVAAVLVAAAGAASASGKTSADGKRISGTVEGVRFSFSVPWKAWESHRLFISRSTSGSQAAEGMIVWAGFRDGGEVTPCGKLLSAANRGSTADLAAAVARAPGTQLVSGPTRVTIGGRPATHVELTVRKDLGCDPGFFFTWRPRGPRGECGGACWLESSVGDTIKVWIVDVGEKRLFIEAQTRDPNSFLSYQIGKIVKSIRFTSVVVR